MLRHPLSEIVLETEADNVSALAFYDKLGFIREKRLHRFYLNGKDAFRLVLPLSQAVLDQIQVTRPGVGLGDVVYTRR